MRKTTTRVLGAASLAGFIAAATLALAPAAQADTVASSAHTSGVNVAMADGSVRFVTQSIGSTVGQAIGSRSGGEVVSDF